MHTIEREVGGLQGVESVMADEKTQIVKVAFEPESLWPEIDAFLAAIGYPTEEA